MSLQYYLAIIVVGGAIGIFLRARSGKPRSIFSGAPFYFRAITPFVALFTWMLLYSWDRNTPGQKVGIGGVIVLMWLLVLALANPRKFHWAARAIAGVVALGCIAGLVMSVTFAVTHRTVAGDNDHTSLLRALFGALLFGVPSFIYALSGRFPSEHLEDKDRAATTDSGALNDQGHR